MSVCVYYKGRQIANVCGGVYQPLVNGEQWMPVTPSTLFMAYSVVKGVVATALLTCVDGGMCRCAFLCMYVCLYACMYVCMYVCVYVFIFSVCICLFVCVCACA